MNKFMFFVVVVVLLIGESFCIDVNAPDSVKFREILERKLRYKLEDIKPMAAVEHDGKVYYDVFEALIAKYIKNWGEQFSSIVNQVGQLKTSKENLNAYRDIDWGTNVSV